MAERQNTLRTAIFSGNVRMVDSGKQPMQGSAGRAVLNFVGNNVLTTVHTQDNVRLAQHQQPAKPSESAQDVEINGVGH